MHDLFRFWNTTLDGDHENVTGTLALAHLDDPRAGEERLTACGLGPSAAPAGARLLGRAARSLIKAGVDARSAVTAFFVPGRIEVLGKHTDYAGGRSLLATTERGFMVVASPRGDARIHMIDAMTEERVAFTFGDAPRPGHWSLYSMTVARRMAGNFPASHRGADIAFASALPPAAGMSSSTALLTGTFLALTTLNRLQDHPAYRDSIDNPEALAAYLGAVENGSTFAGLPGNEGVGTAGGCEDSTAMLCCRPDHLSQYAFCPTRHERTLALPGGTVFAVASSGVRAEKTGRARDRYNRAARLAAAAAAALSQPHLGASLAPKGATAGGLRESLRTSRGPEFSPEALVQRFDHFHRESEEIVPAATAALAAGDLARFGRLVADSVRLADRLLGNQVPETLFLADAAADHGALAASPFGAGFGGSVWALVNEAGARSFLTAWASCYEKAFPHRTPTFFLTGAGPAAFEIPGE